MSEETSGRNGSTGRGKKLSSTEGHTGSHHEFEGEECRTTVALYLALINSAQGRASTAKRDGSSCGAGRLLLSETAEHVDLGTVSKNKRPQDQPAVLQLGTRLGEPMKNDQRSGWLKNLGWVNLQPCREGLHPPPHGGELVLGAPQVCMPDHIVIR